MTNEQKSRILREFIKLYYEDTTSEYESIDRHKREMHFQETIFIPYYAVNAVLVIVCRNLGWVESKRFEDPFKNSFYTRRIKYHLCDDAYDTMQYAIKFVHVREEYPYSITGGGSNFAFLREREGASIEICFERAYRRTTIDAILADLAHDPVTA